MSQIAVIYWSQTGNTEQMANAICEGIKSAGGEAVLLHWQRAVHWASRWLRRKPIHSFWELPFTDST